MNKHNQKRFISVALATVMFAGSVSTMANLIVEPSEVKESSVQEQNALRSAGAPDNIDETNIAAGKQTNWTNVQMPITKEIFVNDTQITGKADPNAEIMMQRNGGDTVKVTDAADDGTFTIELSNHGGIAEPNDKIVLHAVKGGKESPKAELDVITVDTPQGGRRGIYTVYGNTLGNKGIMTDKNGKKYYAIDLEYSLASEAYLDQRRAHMYMQIAPELAEYVDVIMTTRPALSDAQAEKLGEDNNEIKGATNIWELPLISSEGGPIRAALLGANLSSTLKVYLKDEIPEHVLEGDHKFKTWSRLKNGDIGTDYEKNLMIKNLDAKVWSEDEYFKTDSGAPTPILDTADLNYAENTITTKYRIKGSGLQKRNHEPYDLYISTSPALAEIIDENVKIGNKYYTLDKSKAGEGNLILRDVTGKNSNKNGIVSTTLVNRQDYTIVMKIKDGKNIGDAITGVNETIPINMTIRDNTTFSYMYDTMKSSVENIQTKNMIGNFEGKNLSALKEAINGKIENEKGEQKNLSNEGKERIKKSEFVKPDFAENVMDMLNFLVENPTFANVRAVQNFINDASNDDMGKGSSNARKNREVINSALKGLEDLARYIESPMNKPGDVGLSLRNTDAGTYIEAKDTDGDKIMDSYESNIGLGINANLKDSDGDGVPDGQEYYHGTDPTIAPFNWHNTEGEFMNISEETETITGYVGNNSSKSRNGLVEPRTVQLWKVNESGADLEMIAETQSLNDEKGSFQFDTAGKIKAQDRLVVKIITNKVSEEIDKEEVVFQYGYANPEVSAIYKVKEKTDTPTVNNADNFESEFTYIEGTAPKGSNVTITFPNGSTVTAIADNETGKYKAMIADAGPVEVALNEGDQFYVTAEEDGKSVSERVPVTVKASVEKPTVDDVHTGDSTVTGTAPAGSTLTAKIERPTGENQPPEIIEIDSNLITGPDESGNYSIDTAALGIKEGDKVVVTASQEGKVPNSAEDVANNADFESENIKDIKIIAPPSTEYTEGYQIDYTNMQVELTDKRGNKKVVIVETPDGKELTDLGLTLAPSRDQEGGLKTTDEAITVSKGAVSSAPLDITVNAKEFNKNGITKIELVTPPVLTYKDETNFDPSGLKVKITDNQGLEKEVPYSEFKEYGLSTDINEFTTLNKEEHNGYRLKVTSENGKLLVLTDPLTVTREAAEEYVVPDFPPIVKNAGEKITRDEIVAHIREQVQDPEIEISFPRQEADPEQQGMTEFNLTGPAEGSIPSMLTFTDNSEKEISVPLIVKANQIQELEVVYPNPQSPRITIKTPDERLDRFVLDLGTAGDTRQVILTKEDGVWKSDNPRYTPSTDSEGNLIVDASVTERYTLAGQPIKVQGFDPYGNYTSKASGVAGEIGALETPSVVFPTPEAKDLVIGNIDERANLIEIEVDMGNGETAPIVFYGSGDIENRTWHSAEPGITIAKVPGDSGEYKVVFDEKNQKIFDGKDMKVKAKVIYEDNVTEENYHKAKTVNEATPVEATNVRFIKELAGTAKINTVRVKDKDLSVQMSDDFAPTDNTTAQMIIDEGDDKVVIDMTWDPVSKQYKAQYEGEGVPNDKDGKPINFIVKESGLDRIKAASTVVKEFVDKAALEESIGSAEALNLPEDSTGADKAVLDALKKAKEVRDSHDSSQAQVDAAKEALDNALANRDAAQETADIDAARDALRKAISNANNIIGNPDNNKTPQTIEALTEAKTAGEDIVETSENKDDIIAKTNAIIEAISNLKDKADTAELKELYDSTANETSPLQGEELATEQQALNNKRRKAKEVLDNQNATQEQVDEALRNLQNAVDDLENKKKQIAVDKLREAVAEAEEPATTAGKTPESSQPYKDRGKEGRGMLNAIDGNTADYTVDQINEKTQAILDAKQGLADKANKDGLNQSIAEAKGMKDDSLADAIAAAQDVSDNQNATQDEVDNAKSALENEINKAKAQKAIDDMVDAVGTDEFNDKKAAAEAAVNALSDEEPLKEELNKVKDAAAEVDTVKYNPSAADTARGKVNEITEGQTENKDKLSNKLDELVNSHVTPAPKVISSVNEAGNPIDGSEGKTVLKVQSGDKANKFKYGDKIKVSYPGLAEPLVYTVGQPGVQLDDNGEVTIVTADLGNKIPQGNIQITAIQGERSESSPVNAKVTLDDSKAAETNDKVPAGLDPQKPGDKAIIDAQKELGNILLNPDGHTQEDLDNATKKLQDALLDKSYQDALEAVKKAKQDPTNENVLAAQAAINAVDDTIKKDDLNKSFAPVKEAREAVNKAVQSKDPVDIQNAQAAINKINPAGAIVDSDSAIGKPKLQEELDEVAKTEKPAITEAVNTPATDESAGKTTVKGTAPKGSIVTVKVGENKIVTIADDEGNYSVEFGNNLPDGAEIVVTAQEEGKKPSDSVTGNVAVDKTPLDSLPQKVDPANTPEETALNEAIEKAEALKEKEGVTQKEIDDAVAEAKAKKKAIDDAAGAAAEEEANQNAARAAINEAKKDPTRENIDKAKDAIGKVTNEGVKEAFTGEITPFDEARTAVDNAKNSLNPTDVAAAEEKINELKATEGNGVENEQENVDSGKTALTNELNAIKSADIVPEIETKTETGTKISGTAEPGSYVTIQIPGKDPMTTKADEQGNFKFENLGKEIPNGTEITVSSHKEGKVDPESKKVTVVTDDTDAQAKVQEAQGIQGLDENKPEDKAVQDALQELQEVLEKEARTQKEIDDAKAKLQEALTDRTNTTGDVTASASSNSEANEGKGMTKVTGTAPKGSKVTVTVPTGEGKSENYEVDADAETGEFSVDIGNDVPKGTVVTVTAKDGDKAPRTTTAEVKVDETPIETLPAKVEGESLTPEQEKYNQAIDAASALKEEGAKPTQDQINKAKAAIDEADKAVKNADAAAKVQAAEEAFNNNAEDKNTKLQEAEDAVNELPGSTEDPEAEDYNPEKKALKDRIDALKKAPEIAADDVTVENTAATDEEGNNGNTKVTVKVPENAKPGDKIVITPPVGEPVEVELNNENIAKGKVSADLGNDIPDGSTIEVNSKRGESISTPSAEKTVSAARENLEAIDTSNIPEVGEDAPQTDKDYRDALNKVAGIKAKNDATQGEIDKAVADFNKAKAAKATADSNKAEDLLKEVKQDPTPEKVLAAKTAIDKVSDPVKKKALEDQLSYIDHAVKKVKAAEDNPTEETIAEAQEAINNLNPAPQATDEDMQVGKGKLQDKINALKAPEITEITALNTAATDEEGNNGNTKVTVKLPEGVKAGDKVVITTPGGDQETVTIEQDGQTEVIKDLGNNIMGDLSVKAHVERGELSSKDKSAVVVPVKDALNDIPTPESVADVKTEADKEYKDAVDNANKVKNDKYATQKEVDKAKVAYDKAKAVKNAVDDADGKVAAAEQAFADNAEDKDDKIAEAQEAINSLPDTVSEADKKALQDRIDALKKAPVVKAEDITATNTPATTDEAGNITKEGKTEVTVKVPKGAKAGDKIVITPPVGEPVEKILEKDYEEGDTVTHEFGNEFENGSKVKVHAERGSEKGDPVEKAVESDYTPVENLPAKIQEKTEADKKYNEAIDNANDVRNNKVATQKQIDDAGAALKKAKAEKDAVNAANAAVNAATADPTDENIDNAQNLVNALPGSTEDPQAEDYNPDKKDLQDKLNELKKAPAVKAEDIKAVNTPATIDEAGNITEDGKTEVTVKVPKGAKPGDKIVLTLPKDTVVPEGLNPETDTDGNVIVKKELTQDDINTGSVSTVLGNKLQNGSKVKVHVERDQAAGPEASTTVKSDYSPLKGIRTVESETEADKKYNKAVKEAQDVADNEKATQEEIDNAKAAVEKAKAEKDAVNAANEAVNAAKNDPTAEKVNDAQNLVDALPGSTEDPQAEDYNPDKDKLQKELDKIKPGDVESITSTTTPAETDEDGNITEDGKTTVTVNLPKNAKAGDEIVVTLPAGTDPADVPNGEQQPDGTVTVKKVLTDDDINNKKADVDLGNKIPDGTSISARIERDGIPGASASTNTGVDKTSLSNIPNSIANPKTKADNDLNTAINNANNVLNSQNPTQEDIDKAAEAIKKAQKAKDDVDAADKAVTNAENTKKPKDKNAAQQLVNGLPGSTNPNAADYNKDKDDLQKRIDKIKTTGGGSGGSGGTTPVTPTPKPGDDTKPVKPDDDKKPEVETEGIHKQYMAGYPDGSVRPERSLTRAEIAALLSRLEVGDDDIVTTIQADYSDIEGGWYEKYINYVTEHGIMNGYPDGTFRPNDFVSRAELSKMIATLDIDNDAIAPFIDIEGHWAEPSIDKIYGNGRIDGYEDGTFKPDQDMTRAEAAKILNSFYDRGVDEEGLANVENPEELTQFTDLNKEHWGYYELIEATNTHEYKRDKDMGRFEKWIKIIKEKLLKD